MLKAYSDEVTLWQEIRYACWQSEWVVVRASELCSLLLQFKIKQLLTLIDEIYILFETI